MAGTWADGAPTAAVAALRRSSLALWRRGVPPRQFRWLCSLSVWALALLIISGAAVRLTGSGLGCSDWPTCTNGHVVAPLQYHAWVEFGNRLVVAVSSVAIALATVASLLRRPRRRDLVLLSLGMVAGVIGQIVLGGITVLEHLDPPFVMAHFLLSALLLADAVVLRHRAAMADHIDPASGRAQAAGTSVPLVSREHLILGRLLLVATAVVVTLGTVVTSTGPHGGSPSAPRFSLSLHQVAQLHGTSVEIYLALTLFTLWRMHRAGVPSAVLRKGEILLVVLVAQAGVGYTQYFTGDPVLVVGIHEVGAVSVMLAVLAFNLSLRTRRVLVTDVEPPVAPADSHRGKLVITGVDTP
jgi:heme a synthase